MENATKHGAVLIGGGIVGVASISLPWADGLSLLQLVSANEVSNAFEPIPLSFAGSDLQLFALYLTFYTMFFSSSFMIAVGLLQYENYRSEFRWMRLLSISLYGVSVLAAVYYPGSWVEFGSEASGFFLFLVPPVMFVASEHRFEKGSSLRLLFRTFADNSPEFNRIRGRL
jgi:hypothetical protein